VGLSQCVLAEPRRQDQVCCMHVSGNFGVQMGRVFACVRQVWLGSYGCRSGGALPGLPGGSAMGPGCSSSSSIYVCTRLEHHEAGVRQECAVCWKNYFTSGRTS
jgi:hypothetical protein